MGNTGAGKSTLVNAIISGKEAIIQNDDGLYDCHEDKYLMKNGRRMFVIGHNAASCTETPGFYDVDSSNGKFYFVDCPGFSDNNRNLEFPNRTIVHKIMREAKSVKICLVINYNELTCRRSQFALEVLCTVSRLFTKSGVESGKLIIPVINQAAETDANIGMITHKF